VNDSAVVNQLSTHSGLEFLREFFIDSFAAFFEPQKAQKITKIDSAPPNLGTRKSKAPILSFLLKPLPRFMHRER
jgi:hypothetical protein